MDPDDVVELRQDGLPRFGEERSGFGAALRVTRGQSHDPARPGHELAHGGVEGLRSVEVDTAQRRIGGRSEVKARVSDQQGVVGVFELVDGPNEIRLDGQAELPLRREARDPLRQHALPPGHVDHRGRAFVLGQHPAQSQMRPQRHDGDERQGAAVGGRELASGEFHDGNLKPATRHPARRRLTQRQGRA